MIRITVTGGVTFARNGVVVTGRALGGRHVRVALAFLVLERHRSVSKDALADALWPDTLPPTWESMVRTVLTRIRKAVAALGPDSGVALVSDAGGHRLVIPEDAVVDVEEAERLVTAAEEHFDAGDAATARPEATAAASMLSEPLLAGEEGEWLDRRRERIDELAVRALELIAACALAEGDTSTAVADATRAIERAPFRESAHRLLMQAHWAGGSRGEALLAYERCRRTLAEELGVDPAPATEELYLSLLASAPALTQPPPVDGTLIGREADLRRIRDLLTRARLVTVTGVGGVGKTRVAVALTDRSSGAHDGGVAWVDLATVGPDGVGHALVHAVGAPRLGVGALESAVAVLQQRDGLIVLDNCEHVAAAAADAAQALLAGCPRVVVLATSRTPLGIPGEQVVPLEPLRAADACDLFFERAAAAGGDVRATEAELATVATICDRLDGLPLAIELAAARTRSLRPAQIATHLDQRFRLLQRRGTGAARHRSLDEAVRWSYDLLSDAEQRMFRRLSVFTGPFSADAGRAVARDETWEIDELEFLDLLSALVDQSMVVTVPAGDESRYQLIETLREYGRLRLDEGGETAACLERHAAHYIALVEAASPGLQGPAETRWVSTLNAELPNLLAAFTYCARWPDVDRSLRFVVATFEYALYRMHLRLADCANEAVSLPGAEAHPLYGPARAVAGYLAWLRGSVDEAAHHLEIARSHGDNWITADAEGTVALFLGDIDTSRAVYARATQEARRAANAHLLAVSLSQEAFARILAGADGAHELATVAEAAAEQAGSATARAQAAWALGLADFDRDPQGALAHLDRTVALATQVENKLAAGAASDPAAGLRSKLSRQPAASDLTSSIEQLEYWVEQGNPPNIWAVLRRLVRQFASLGLYEEAAMFAGAEESAVLKVPARERERVHHGAIVERIRDELTRAEYERLTAAGADLTQTELLDALRTAVARAT